MEQREPPKANRKLSLFCESLSSFLVAETFEVIDDTLASRNIVNNHGVATFGAQSGASRFQSSHESQRASNDLVQHFTRSARLPRRFLAQSCAETGRCLLWVSHTRPRLLQGLR